MYEYLEKLKSKFDILNSSDQKLFNKRINPFLIQLNREALNWKVDYDETVNKIKKILIEFYSKTIITEDDSEIIEIHKNIFKLFIETLSKDNEDIAFRFFKVCLDNIKFLKTSIPWDIYYDILEVFFRSINNFNDICIFNIKLIETPKIESYINISELNK